MTRHIGSLVHKFSVSWEGFWISKGSTFNLALFRILFAICLFLEVSMTFNKSLFAIEGDFHLPYLELIPTVSAKTYEWIHDLQYPFILLLGLGLFSRFSCSALLVLQGYIIFADQLNFRNHPYFFLLVLFLLLFSPVDDALSIKSIFRAMKNRRPVIASLLGSQQPLTFQRLIQVQVCIVYLYAAFHKLNMGYLSGLVLDHYLVDFSSSGRPGIAFKALFADPFLTSMENFVLSEQTLMTLSALTVVFELGLPFVLWFRKTRPIAIILGIGFHLGIFFGMDILNFSLAMIATYLLFLDPETLVARLRRIMLHEQSERVGKSEIQRDGKRQGRRKRQASTKR